MSRRLRAFVSLALGACIWAGAGSANAGGWHGGGWHGGGWHGGGWHGGGWHGGGWHGSVGIFVGPYFGAYGYPYYPYYPYYWGYPYYAGYPYFAGYPYYGPYRYAPYYAPYPADSPAASLPYVERSRTAAPAYWYYCTAPSGYYPYVKNCSKSWVKVRPQDVPAPPNASPTSAASSDLG